MRGTGVLAAFFFVGSCLYEQDPAFQGPSGSGSDSATGTSTTSTQASSATSVTTTSTSETASGTSTTGTTNSTETAGDCVAGVTDWASPTLEQVAPMGGDGFEQTPAGAFEDGGAAAGNFDAEGHAHIFHGFDVPVPAGCAIRGIEVSVDWWVDDTQGAGPIDVRVSATGDALVMSAGREDTLVSVTEHTGILGAPTDRWNLDWSASDLLSDDLWVRIETAEDETVSPDRDTFVDWIRVRAHYGAAIETTGFVSPTMNAPQATGDGDGFEVTPDGAYAPGGDVASDMDSGTSGTQACPSGSRDAHVYSGYDLSALPAAAQIIGVHVRVDGWATEFGGSPGYCVRLSWDAGTNWTPGLDTGNLGQAQAQAAAGGDAELWGRVWAKEDFSAANFRVEISTNGGGMPTNDFFLDWLPVTVHYDTP